MIKLQLETKSSFLSRKIKFSLKVWALNVDINLLNRHCKPADWPAEWLLDLLRHFGTQGTRALVGQSPLEGHSGTQGIRRALGRSGIQGTWAFEALEHSKGTWAHEHSKLLGTWTLRHLGSWAVERKSGTPGTSGTLFRRLMFLQPKQSNA